MELIIFYGVMQNQNKSISIELYKFYMYGFIDYIVMLFCCNDLLNIMYLF